MKSTFVSLALVASAVALADTVVPNAFATTEAPGTFFLTSTSSAGRTYMYTIAASQLGAVAGENLTGLSLRLGNTSAAWPATPASFSMWDIWIGDSVAPSAMSNTFLSNFTGTPTQVRSGGLTFNPGDFPTGASGSTANAFGAVIDFNLGSYTYSGGDLAILMRFSAQSGATAQPGFDAVAATDTGNGWGTLFAARWTGNAAGTTGSNGNFLVTNLRSEPVPEPATLAVLGMGAAAMIRRRRAK